MSEAIRTQIRRWDGEVLRTDDDDLAREEPLEIRVNGQAVSVTMRTPGHDAELALGFLLSEGLIRSGADVASVAHLEKDAACNTIDLRLTENVDGDLERLTRHVFASSSCGICGKATIASIRQLFPPVTSEVRVSPERLATLPERLRASQATFARTGGLHAAAVFDADGEMRVVREDIGRHNAVDKVLGWSLQRHHAGFEDDVLLVSGRSSFEIMQKALAGRIPIVAAVSAPSSLAVQFAEESGQTLVGFLRDGRMNVYAGIERIS